MWVLWLSMQAPAAVPPPPPLWWQGRVYSAPALHVGVRSACLVTPEERALGVTVQLRLPLP